jgi:pimeloyl-ACP methyl ester carboxylesterase
MVNNGRNETTAEDLSMRNFPVYALPGLLDDERLWQHQTAHLAAHHDLVTADLSGHDTIAALAAAALAKAPAERFALVGLSMGGYVAMEIMRQAPERVLALALLDTNSRPDTAAAIDMRKNMMALAKSDFQTVIDSLTPRLLHPDHLADRTIVKVIEDMAHSVGPAAFERQQTAIMGRIDSRPSLLRVNCPSLVLCGREDLLTPLELHEEMAGLIPGARLTVIEHCGHMSALEQPQQVSAALAAWLASVQA